MGEVIGVPLELDQLVLMRGRDFKWTFQNLDPVSKQPVDFPPGDLFFEISTHGEHNGRGRIDQNGASGGTFIIDREDGVGSPSSALPFDASQLAIRQAIEDLDGVGEGNVTVTGYYIPQWIFIVDWSDAMPLSAGVIEVFNATVHTAFVALNLVTGGLGVSLDGRYESSSFVLRLTHQGSLLESEIVSFVAGVAGTIISAINSALTAVEQFSGEIADISMIYAPVRHFDYEFINERALTPMPQLKIVPSLTGHTPVMTVVQDAKGRAPFTIWNFEIDGTDATIKVESEEADTISNRIKWQLVFLPEGEPSGGDAIARGVVKVQAER